MDNLTMSDFNDTFNMFVGIKNKEIDWFDNPYLEMNVYEVDENWAPYLSPRIKLMQCTRE